MTAPVFQIERFNEITANFLDSSPDPEIIFERLRKEAARLTFLSHYLQRTKPFSQYSWNERVQLTQQFEFILGLGKGSGFTQRQKDEQSFYNTVYADLEISAESLKIIRPDSIPVTNCGLEPYVQEAMEKMMPFAEKKILEVGGGGGIFGLWLALQGADVTILDVSEKALEVAKKREDALRTIYGRAFKGCVRYAAIPAERMDYEYPPGYFDHVFAYAVVHHLETESFAYALEKVLKPQGTVILCYEPLYYSKWMHSLRQSALVTSFFPPGSETQFERRLDHRDLGYYRNYFEVELLPSNFVINNLIQRFFLLIRHPWYWAFFKIMIWPQQKTKWSYDQFGDVSSRCLAREYALLRKFPVLKYLCGNTTLILKRKNPLAS